MIFHRPFLIEQKLNFSTEIDETFLEIRFSPSFVIGQVVEIFNLADLTAYFLTESKKVLKIWGKVIEIDTDKIRIMVMSKLIWTIDEILVTNSEDVFPIFNPSLLGRFWSMSSGFLENKWQEEEVHEQLLGSKLLEGKKVNYKQTPLNWNIDKFFNSQTDNQNGKQHDLVLRHFNDNFKQILAQNYHQKSKNNLTQVFEDWQDLENTLLETKNKSSIFHFKISNHPKILSPKYTFTQNCGHLITKIKEFLPQPIFIILSQNCDEAELKNFYFQMSNEVHLFNCFVIVSENQTQNTFLTEKSLEITNFFEEVLQKSVFLIS